MYVEDSGGTGTVHRSAGVRTLQPRQRQHLCYFVGACRRGDGGRSACPASTQPRGGCVSPSVHRQPAVRGDGGRVARAPVERRRTHASRPPRRSGNRPPARFRVRRLRGSRRRRRGDQPVRSAAVQRTPLAVSEARPREERPAGAPRPGGFSGPRPVRAAAAAVPAGSPPRPSGWAPRPADGGGSAPRAPRSRNFGPDAPPKNKRKPPRKDGDRGPKGPIKERPVSRLYENDEDWRNDEARRRHRRHRDERESGSGRRSGRRVASAREDQSCRRM